MRSGLGARGESLQAPSPWAAGAEAGRKTARSASLGAVPLSAGSCGEGWSRGQTRLPAFFQVSFLALCRAAVGKAALAQA